MITLDDDAVDHIPEKGDAPRPRFTVRAICRELPESKPIPAHVLPESDYSKNRRRWPPIDPLRALAAIVKYRDDHGEDPKTFEVAVILGYANGRRHPKIKTSSWNYHGPEAYTRVMEALRELEASGLAVRVGAATERTRKHWWSATAKGRLLVEGATP